MGLLDGWTERDGRLPDQHRLGVDTGSPPGKSGGPGAASLAQGQQGTGVRVPSGTRVASGPRSLAWECGVGSLAGEWWDSEEEFLWGEERGTGTECLGGDRQGPVAGVLPAEHWGMPEAMSAESPCPAAGPVLKERAELKATVSGWRNKCQRQAPTSKGRRQPPGIFHGHESFLETLALIQTSIIKLLLTSKSWLRPFCSLQNTSFFIIHVPQEPSHESQGQRGEGVLALN